MPVIPPPAYPTLEVCVSGAWQRLDNASPPAVARILGVNRSTVGRWFRSGNLPADRVRVPVDNPMDNSGGAE